MTIWGKLGGAAAGFALGGPIGALAGTLAGHFLVDEGLLAPDARPPRETVAFTVGLVALAAKMAKADGVITCNEVDAFRRLVKIAPEDEPRVVALFDLAKQSVAGFDAYARQLRDLLKDEPKTLEDLLDGLFGIATADGAVHEAELAYLAEVASIFGLSEAEFECVKSRHVVIGGGADPYRVLGIAPDVSNETIKTTWRALVTEYHPDKLMARGVPAEMIALATAKIAAINAAYSTLRKARGFA
ncbi:TerB family tellurite resistance protein [Phreatobacter stygius]|uniref:Molecular chaperone DjiA n=1 Tax=Phreatobacter stygius TaxID=1940610 RepID=A0A4D7AZN0_9HYPH|nr:TerB family tellurite resistance protein [Phreatobacter stygius]QCI65811.1 molecular chaperone DjiA [Phreatobacter stygius]